MCNHEAETANFVCVCNAVLQIKGGMVPSKQLEWRTKYGER
jgi:hypothetical protein